MFEVRRLKDDYCAFALDNFGMCRDKANELRKTTNEQYEVVEIRSVYCTQTLDEAMKKV